MATGDRFKKAIRAYIESWNLPIDIKEEKPVGYRFVGKPRHLDLILKHSDTNKYLGVEAKFQKTGGTTFQKLSYALQDCKASPIPTLLVFADPNNNIAIDLKAQLIFSGIGIELDFKYDEDDESTDTIIDPNNLFRQRVYIELGFDWFTLF
ncbi:MAG TPA: PD-(D/E)XK nuclease superfamily protein [bacterium]|nr:PD-(D/E)XK nuclease superfamily protein [bacterium]